MSDSAPVPRFSSPAPRDYWLCQVAGWGALTLALVLSTSSGPADFVLRFAATKIACGLSGLALSHGWYKILSRAGWLNRKDKIPFAPIARWLAGLATVQTALLALFDWLFRQGALLNDAADTPVILLLLYFLWYVVFAVWTLCYTAALSRRRALRAEFEKLALEVSMKETELRAMQAQVNPHFFFNSLNAIRALVHQDQAAASRAVDQLSAMMRYSLNAGRARTVPLSEEIAAIEAYLAIERLRFEDRLQVSLDIAPELRALPVPPMALQTLIENAVKYGVERSVGPCPVTIAAERREHSLRLSVTNRGILSDDAESTRIGLNNTHARLQLLFGTEARCDLRQEGEQVVAEIILPLAAP